MAFTIPPFEIEDIPMRLEPWGAEFCRINDESFLANFALYLKATAPDEWDVVDVYMGTQRLKGDMFRKFAQHFESEHGAKISDHVAEHLPYVKADAFNEAREFAKGF
jgi:hypothetical protein